MLAAEPTGTPGAALDEPLPSGIAAADFIDEAASCTGCSFYEILRSFFQLATRRFIASADDLQADGRGHAGRANHGLIGSVDAFPRP
jgi:hypothetical protein